LNVDPKDTDWRDSPGERLLEQIAVRLVADARAILLHDPSVRLAGVIVLPTAAEIPMVREILANLTGPTPPSEPLVGLVPRTAIDALLSARFGDPQWQEQGWRGQWTLPVVVSTPAGFRFAFLDLNPAPDRRHEL
jgi:hypothetical protein